MFDFYTVNIVLYTTMTICTHDTFLLRRKYFIRYMLLFIHFLPTAYFREPLAHTFPSNMAAVQTLSPAYTL